VASTWSSTRWADGTARPPCGPPGTLGRFCVIGFASGPIASIPLNQILLNNRTVMGVDWGGWTFKDPFGNRALIDELMEMVGKRTACTRCARSAYPLEWRRPR
jgi:hypothetical protein